MDEAKLMEFVGQTLGDVGAMLGGAMVVIGDKLGLYRAMAGAGSLTSEELADKTGTAERYVRRVVERTGGTRLCVYDGDGRFTLPDEHAIPLTDETSPACVIGAFETALGVRLRHRHHHRAVPYRRGFLVGGAGSTRVGRLRAVLPAGISQLSGHRVDSGSRWHPSTSSPRAPALPTSVVDTAASTLLLAEAFPASDVVGFDAHEGSVERRPQTSRRCRTCGSSPVPGSDGRAPSRAPTTSCVSSTACTTWAIRLAHAHTCGSHLAPGGTLMLIEPFADDDLADNLNPVGAAYYAFSTLCAHRARCPRMSAPHSGAQAG